MRFSAGDKIIMFSKCLCDCLFLCLCHCHCLFAGHVISHHRSDHMSQGSLGVFFGSVFKSVDGKVISRAVLRGPAKNIPPQLEQLQVHCTTSLLSLFYQLLGGVFIIYQLDRVRQGLICRIV